MSKTKVFSMFSGAGGFELGFDDKFELVGLSEIDKYASAVLRKRFSEVKNYGDVTQLDVKKLPDFELLVGGSPCQSFSIAGKREGLKGESGLFYHYVKVLKEKRPKHFIWENVKGTLSSTKGWDFACVQMELAEIGYNIRWEVLNAKNFGVPQNRERVFIVGSLREQGRGKIFCETTHSGTNATKTTKNSKDIKKLGNLYNDPKGHSPQSGRVYSADGISPTLKQPSGGGAMPLIQVDKKLGTKNYGQIKPLEVANCLDANYYKGMDNHGQRTIVCLNPKARTGDRIYDPEGVSPSLHARTANNNKGSKLIAYSKSTRDKHIDHRTRIDDTANTLNTGDGCVSQSSANLVNSNTKIRRLTPTECESLMSWPKNHTQYGEFYNKKTDSYDTKEISDTQRYKMCGNGVVSNCIKAIVDVLLLP